MQPVSLVDPSIGEAAGCPVCGSPICTPAPPVDHHASYPFLPGGRDKMADPDFVIATEPVVDPASGEVVYEAGARVPVADAARYGVTPAKAKRRGRRAKKGPAEDRAHHGPDEDR